MNNRGVLQGAVMLFVLSAMTVSWQGCAAPPKADCTCCAKSDESNSGPRCALSPDELRANRETLIPGLLKRADEVVDVENGCRMRFTNRPGLLDEITRVVEKERTCCSFLRFQIVIQPEGGPIYFEVTGPPGTREMLKRL